MAKKNNKKNKKNNRMLLLILLLLLTLVASGSATYAWFTANKKVSMEGINVTATTSNGLQISTSAGDTASDGDEWDAKVDSDDFKKTTDVWTKSGIFTSTMTDKTIDAASSAGIVDSNGNLQIFQSDVEQDETDLNKYLLTNIKEAGTNNYIGFDIYLKYTGTEKIDVNVFGYLNSLSEESSTALNVGSKNAVRVAFINEGYAKSWDTMNSTEQGLYSSESDYISSAIINGLKGGTTAKIWEPNANVHTNAAIKAAKTLYGVTINDVDPIESYSAIKAAPTDTTTKINIVEATEDANGGYFKKIGTSDSNYKQTSYSSTTEAKLQGCATLTINPGVNKIRIYMWIEGQDYDAENNATGSNFKLILQFALAS